MIPSVSPAFLVEGELEQRFIQQACPNSPARKVINNGNTVAIRAIGERILTHYKLLRKRHFPIIVIMDRENRHQDWKEIRDELRGYLTSNDAHDVIIGVCDRKIENWILSDKTQFPSIDEPNLTEGKSTIKRIHGSYHETTIGVSLLKKSTPTEIAKRSDSFRDFYEQIKDFPCWWIK